MDLKALQNGSDIRGIALGENANLTSEVAADLAAAFFHWLRVQKPEGMLKFAIGRDSRLTGEDLAFAIADSLVMQGAQVLDCGMASTPAMFMTTVTDGVNADGAIMITASHLPKDRNGMKFFTSKGGLEKGDISKIIELAEKKHNLAPQVGSLEKFDFMSIYADILKDKIKSATGSEYPLKGFHIIVDAGNGAGGFYAKDVLEPLGADTSGSQYLEPDGNFPNHAPNPEDQTAMESLVEAVKKTGADFGLIFDTDVDRAGAVDKGGVILNRNRLIAAISTILIDEYPGTAIVTDSITSAGLTDFIKGLGGIHHRFKRGYRNVINESLKLNSQGRDSQLAIETSGHAALKENYFLDDGAYLVTRLLVKMAQLKNEGKTISDLITDLKEPAESVEMRLKINSQDYKEYGEKIISELGEYANKNDAFIIALENYEGIRISLPKDDGDGWFIVRLSLHEPLIPINIESDSKGGTKRIAKQLYDFLKQYEEIDIAPLKNFIES